MEHIKQTQGLVESFPGYVLRMRGLPYSATPDDVVSLSSLLCLATSSYGKLTLAWPLMLLLVPGWRLQLCHAGGVLQRHPA